MDLNAGDDFLILGSDGLFEFLENHEAVEIVSGCNNDERACSKVLLFCISCALFKLLKGHFET